jgi:hypothetical protein
MLLLDLPPEMFGGFTHQLVSVVGVQQAWILRGVCRMYLPACPYGDDPTLTCMRGTFSAAIEHDISTNQGVSAFDEIAIQKSLQPRIGLYLYFRSKRGLDVYLRCLESST